MTALATTRQQSSPVRVISDSSERFPKHAGAVQVWNAISLLPRKVFAALLVNAYDELPNFSIVEHGIPLSVLGHLSAFKSNNTQYLKDVLTVLATTPLRWNIKRAGGQDAWAVSATLASARIENGKVYYSFSPELRRRLYNPDVYAQLDLAVIRLFKSGYALALYENCALYTETGETDNFTPQDLRGLLGAGDNQKFQNFGRFMDKVIKPATTEVNKHSPFRVEPILTREARRVTAVRFKIEDKNGEGGSGQAPSNPLLGRDVDLVMRIQSEIGLGYGQVIKLFEEYSDSHLLAVLDYVKDRYTRGKVQKGKIAGYFLTVVKKATPDSLSQPQSSLDLAAAPRVSSAEELAAIAAAEAEKEARKQLLAAAEGAWQARAPEEQESTLVAFMAFLAKDNRVVYDSLRRNKTLAPGTMGYRLLLNWLVDAADA